jgi:hypothetical protein
LCSVSIVVNLAGFCRSREQGFVLFLFINIFSDGPGTTLLFYLLISRQGHKRERIVARSLLRNQFRMSVC